MWGILRIILLVGTACLFAFLAYIAIADTVIRSRAHAPLLTGVFLSQCGVFLFLGLNFIYLLLTNQPSNWRISNWRIFRLIGLWFDAKESELRKRARQDK
jgi:hypothetical protein